MERWEIEQENPWELVEQLTWVHSRKTNTQRDSASNKMEGKYQHMSEL